MITAMSRAEFTGAVRAQLPAVGASGSASGSQRPSMPPRQLPGGIEAEQDAVAERAGFASADWLSALAGLQHVEARMVQIPCELYLTHLVITIPGINAAADLPLPRDLRLHPLPPPGSVRPVASGVSAHEAYAGQTGPGTEYVSHACKGIFASLPRNKGGTVRLLPGP